MTETGETILLGVLSQEGHEISYVDVIESGKPLRFAMQVGNRRPLYCTAAGKAMLAFPQLTLKAAEQISKILGFRGPYPPPERTVPRHEIASRRRK